MPRPGRSSADTRWDAIASIPQNLVTDAFNIPATAHYIGGCVIGDSESSGVVDPYQRV